MQDMHLTYKRTWFLISMIILAVLAACGGGGGGSSSSGSSSSSGTAITAPSSVTAEQSGYSASVMDLDGCTYAWTITNGIIMVGSNTSSIAFRPGSSGTVTLHCTVTDASDVSTTSTATCAITAAKTARHTLDDAHALNAQSATLAFACFGMMKGNLQAQTFFPPGKVADYWGFQYMRDNDGESDATGYGHNTDFLGRVACNILYILNDSQITMLKSLASSQVDNINLYGWKRYQFMKAFRMLMDNYSSYTLDEAAVKAASVELYQLDGLISYQRAVVYADIFRSLTAEQKAYISENMVGKGFVDWPDIDMSQVSSKMQGLSQVENVAVMTYASDLYSWYAGSEAADVYYCPERHGTYFGSFYIKDAPAVGNAGYSIDTSMTGNVGGYLTSDNSHTYMSAAGQTLLNTMASTQLGNLYTNSNNNIEYARTMISQALRSLISSEAPSAATLASVQATVDTYSQMYGELDGENNYLYATTFAKIYNNDGAAYLTNTQKTNLSNLWTEILTVDGIDYSTCSSYYLYSAMLDLSSVGNSTNFTYYTGLAMDLLNSR